MIKIKNISQLKAEQQRLMNERLALEYIIEEDWHALKDSLRPKNITKQVFSAVLSKPAPGEGNPMLRHLANFAALGLGVKLLNKMKRKIAGIFS